MSQVSTRKIIVNSIIFLLIAGFLYLIVMKFIDKKEKATNAAIAASPTGPKPAMGVDGIVVKSSAMSDDVDLPGQLLPYEEVDIKPEINGKLIALNIKEGGAIGKGQLIAKIFDADLKAQLNKLNVQLDLAQKTEERLKQLLTINGASKQDYDNAVGQVNNINADIEILKVNLSKTEIRAPFSGKLGLKSVSNGAYVTSGTILTSLQQLNPCKLEFSVPEKYLANIKTNEKVIFTIDGHINPYQATIYAIDTKADPVNRNIKIRASVPNANGSLSPGVFANVKLSLKEGNALLVPSQSIIPDAKSKKVFVVKNGKASLVVIQTGLRNSSMVQVLNGLNIGDTVITTGLLSQKPDMAVKIKAIKTIEK